MSKKLSNILEKLLKNKKLYATIIVYRAFSGDTERRQYVLQDTQHIDKRRKCMIKKLVAMFTVLCLCLMFVPDASAAEAAVSFGTKTMTVEPGKTAVLKPTVTGKDKYTLEWTSSDTKAVKVKDGKITAGKSGKAVVTAKVKGTKAQAKINILIGKRVSSVQLPDSSIELAVGDTYTVKASVTPKDAAYKGVSVKSLKSSVASVKGSVITAKKQGTATVTVKALDGSDKKAVIKVSVVKEKKTDAPAAPKKDKKDITYSGSSAEFVKNIKVGWNLGNALDATGGSGLNTETSWGNPFTTEQMIADINNAGFNAVRIPTTWYKHVDEKGNIDPEWKKRVKQVVDYAYNRDMYVILNSHHDNSYYKIGDAGNEEKEKATCAKMEKLWKQIANEFKDYDEHLIFETLNEPRNEGSALEWNGGTAAERDYISKLNNVIVDAIRSTGGNNKKRFIMCPTNAATSNMNILRNAEFPDDDRVIISVHYYKWDDFSGNATGNFTAAEKDGMNDFFSQLNDIFVSKGRGVIIGECGSTNRNNEAERAKWDSSFVKAGKKYGIPCFFWDNNADGNGQEHYRLYDRSKNEFPYPSIIDAIVSAAK